MLAREIYKQIRNKAEEVKAAINAVYVARSQPTWNAEALIEYFIVYDELPQEADIRKDDRRHVKVLYADYCGLRDELVALLTTDWVVTQATTAAKAGTAQPRQTIREMRAAMGRGAIRDVARVAFCFTPIGSRLPLKLR